MSKRKIGEVEESAQSGSKSQKVTDQQVDSDEEEFEDESLKYALKDEDIEGQEDGVADAEGDIQFTGFNMKEELEEGHFDKDGMYHWNKEKEVRDNWLDNIDWVKIKKEEGAGAGEEPGMAADSPGEEAVDVTACYKRILSFLQPSESIAKALKRFGGNRSLSASERLKLKKSGQLEKVLSEAADNSAQLTELTELANKILTETGNMDIYQETYQFIQAKLNKTSEKHAKEAVLDMYADDFDEKEKERLGGSAASEASPEKHSSTKTDEVMWEVKRDESSESIEGPFTSAQMSGWSRTRHFGEKALVRKCGSDQFYSQARIDFELYL